MSTANGAKGIEKRREVWGQERRDGQRRNVRKNRKGQVQGNGSLVEQQAWGLGRKGIEGRRECVVRRRDEERKKKAGDK